MLTEETINRLAARDAELRKTFRPLEPVAGSLLAYGAALLDGQAEAAKAERTLCEQVRERLQRERAAQ
jgi:hypothetical protein